MLLMTSLFLFFKYIFMNVAFERQDPQNNILFLCTVLFIHQATEYAFDMTNFNSITATVYLITEFYI